MADTTASMQAFLDSLSPLPGAILYRGKNFWQALLPGQKGQILTIQPNGLPGWESRPRFIPAMMAFNGVNQSYRHLSLPTAGNSVTALIRFTTQPFTGNRVGILAQYQGPSNTIRLNATIGSADHSEVPRRNKLEFQARDSSDTVRMRLFAKQPNLLDGRPHYAFLSINLSAALFTFVIDGEPADDPTHPLRMPPTPATMATGTGELGVGATDGNFFPLPGAIGPFGLADTYLTAWQDFMSSNGYPLPIDTATWQQFGGIPLIWHESGKLDENRGSVGALTAVNAPRLAYPSAWMYT